MSKCGDAESMGTIHCNEAVGISGENGSSVWYKIKASDNGRLTITLDQPKDLKAKLYVFDSCNDDHSDYLCRNSSGSTHAKCVIENAKGYYKIGVSKTKVSDDFQVSAKLQCYDCIPCYRNYCSGNDVWCEDSCSVESRVKEHCGSKGCSNGKCNSAPSCTSECSSGQARCNGSSLQTCGNYDADSCLEWPSSTSGNGNQNCQYGCSSDKCNSAPSFGINILSYSDSIDEGYPGSIQWQVFGSNNGTGVEVSYNSSKTGTTQILMPKNTYGIYTAVLNPKNFSKPFMYVRAYAVGTESQTIYSDWQTISLTPACLNPECSNGSIPFQVEELNFLELGWDGLMFFTIGSCVKNGGIFTLGCTLDLVCLAPIGEAAKLVKGGKEFAMLSKSSKIVKKAGTLQKLALAFKKVRLTLNGVKYSVEGSKLAKAAELGILEVDFAKGEIRTGYNALSGWFLKNGDSVITSLKKSGASNQMLENIIVKGGNLERTIKAAESVKGTAWLEEGSYTKGWLHIFRGHVKPGDFKNAGIADEKVQDYIIKTVKEPSKGILASRGKKGWWCFFSFSKIVSTGSPFVKVIIDDKGYIINSYPTRNYTCS